MKLTKGHLKNLIKEELLHLNENEEAGADPGPVSRSDAMHKFRNEFSVSIQDGNILDAERTYIVNFVEMVINAAKTINLDSAATAMEFFDRGLEELKVKIPTSATPTKAPGDPDLNL